MTDLLHSYKAICNQDKPLHELAVEADMAFTRGQLVDLLEHAQNGEFTEHEEEVFGALADMM